AMVIRTPSCPQVRIPENLKIDAWKLSFTLNQGVIHNAASMGKTHKRGGIPPRSECLPQSIGSAPLNKI
ncbi:MAG: hypothetical protein J6P38_04470, partial [Acetobacter sp.]|nr:hypothetical protein [Acetobacter sp.]